MEDLQTETYFDSRPANEWMNTTSVYRTDMLFGELWMTGELCVMFGEPGIGKSLLAVQIADSINRGNPIGPFRLTAKPQKVLYVDLEKTADQFKQRYSARGEGENSRTRRYKFSRHFHRAVPAAGSAVPIRQLEKMVEQGGAKIVIIDNLPHLVASGRPSQAGRVMRELRRLRTAYGLSILVITQTSRSTSRRGIAAADMTWSQTITALADNIFAVGKGSSSSERYIKHIKPRLAPLIYGTATVPRFDIDNIEANFPQFVHLGFGAEFEVREEEGDEADLIKQIKSFHESNYSVREIAATLEVPKSTVHRYLQILRATAESQPREYYGLEACIVDRCTHCLICFSRAGSLDQYKIGMNEHTSCGDDCKTCGPEVYEDDDTSVPDKVRRASKEFHEKLRDWVIGGKVGKRPTY
ncbi:MAG: AAA family ATPase [Pyrinomonadaceae bacterium]